MRVEWHGFLDAEEGCGHIRTGKSGSWLAHFENIKIPEILGHECSEDSNGRWGVLNLLCLD